MRHFLNKGHMQFDLLMPAGPGQIIGKMIHADEQGCIIVKENDGVEHCYNWDVIKHIVEAP